MPILRVGTARIPHHVITAPERRRSITRRGGNVDTIALDTEALATMWKERTARWEQVRQTPLFLTPTGMGKEGLVVASAASTRKGEAAVGRVVGVVVHRLLERWDFSREPSECLSWIDSVVESVLRSGEQVDASAVTASVRELLVSFTQSDLYRRLAMAEILGREVPLLMPWGERQVMEGVIDVIYRLDGTVWVADYKTDAIEAERAAAWAERYRVQAQVYKEAVRGSLHVEPRFHCLFLRCGVAVEL